MRSQRVIPGYVRMWYECKRECVRVTLICEWPCRIFAISRLDFKLCAIECKMDRLECEDECNAYLFRKLPSRYLRESRRRLYRPENESEPIAKRRFRRRRFRRINSDLKWGNFIKWINILSCLIKWDIKWYTFRTYVGCLFIFSLKKNVLIHGSWVYNYICNQYLSPLKLWIWIPFMARCTRYNLMR